MKRNNSIITDYLHGQCRSEITCPECPRISITFDTFFICTLPIPTNKMKNIVSSKNECSIYDCFDKFEAPEVLTAENMWYCRNCKKHQPAKKVLKIYKAPQYLIIHLQKGSIPSGPMDFFNSSNIKVNFPLELDLSNYVMSPDLPGQEANQKDKSSLLYSLYAVSNNHENINHINNRHYTAFVKNAGMNSWYNFDDSSVYPMSVDSVVSEAAYILFYEKKGINKNCIFEIE